jgi:hypothetical protein
LPCRLGEYPGNAEPCGEIVAPLDERACREGGVMDIVVFDESAKPKLVEPLGCGSDELRA